MLKATPAVIYVRKSSVEEEGRSLRQQTEALEARAHREGWEVIATFEEVQSAYAERERPKFSKAMETAEEVGGVLLVWALDRFSRKGAEDVIRLFPRGGKAAPFRLVGEDGTDTADATRRVDTILRAEMALQESDRIGRRIRRARADARGKGLWASGKAPYGFRVEGLGDERRLAVVPEHAEVVRRMGREVAAGTAYREVARALNADGIAPPNTKRKEGRTPAWHPTSVRAILTNPATAGYLPRGTRAADSVENRVRSYVTDDDGQPVAASWGPLIEPREWAEIVGVIVAASRKGRAKGTASDRKPQPPTLLGHVLKCKPCGRSMTARRYKDGERIQYVCGNPNPVKTVKHVSAEAERTDEWVASAVLRRLALLADADASDPVVTAVAREWVHLTGADVKTPERSTVVDRVADLEAARERTARMIRDGLVPEALGATMLAETAASLTAAREALDALPSSDPASEVLGWLADLGQSTDDGNPFEIWDALSPEVRRSVIAATVERIDLGPGKVGGRYSVEEWADRFAFVWRS